MFTQHPSAASARLFRFLATHRDGLIHAASLLGGVAAGRRTTQLLDVLSIPQPCITHGIQHKLVSLHRLLALEDVADPDSTEADYFALIDPGDPVVADICELTDGLGACLRDLATAEADYDPLPATAA